ERQREAGGGAVGDGEDVAPGPALLLLEADELGVIRVHRWDHQRHIVFVAASARGGDHRDGLGEPRLVLTGDVALHRGAGAISSANARPVVVQWGMGRM